VTIEKGSGTIVGSTRFGGMDATHRRVEIGWTWIVREWRRTAVNTEAKYLMLRHAFEVLGCNRVEFKTDELNERSRTALRRLGAREEGVFRNHMVTVSGRVRNTVYYSIINSEWPEVKIRLEEKLHRPTGAQVDHKKNGSVV
jgi:RimJ/RimL family protein N-acetyltransferase